MPSHCLRLILGCWIALVMLPAVAAPINSEPLRWLERVAAAPRKLNFTGTFVFQSGDQSETSRIVHVTEGGHERERLEVIDGSPREVLRTDDEVQCLLPDSRLMIVERRTARRQFPALLPASLTGLSDHYVLRMGRIGRVAGHESQQILIEPRDELRYARQFWVDVHSGLLLKATLSNEKGELLESFAFTELTVGAPVPEAALKPRATGGDWKVVHSRSSETRLDDTGWVLRTPLPGFRKLSGMKRSTRADGPEMLHLVYSDGLAAVSVFIEQAGEGRKPELGEFSLGAINVYRRALGEHQLTVLGDVPFVALKKLGDALEPRRR